MFPPATPALVREARSVGAKVIAVDAGAEACLGAGVVPTAIVGDMDSVRPATLTALEARGARVVRHPAKKRDTDGALALREVEGDVVFVGAGGGRPDHAFASLHLMHHASRRGGVRGVDHDARSWVVTRERPLRLDLPEGATVSVIPLFEDCEGVTYRALEYPLDDATLTIGDPYGMSNRALAPPQEIRLRRGTLLVVAPRET